MSRHMCLGIILALVFAAVTVVALLGCGGGGGDAGGGDTGGITDAQLADIEQASAQVDQLVEQQGMDDPEQLAVQAQALPAVEWAEADDDSLTVKYEHGGQQAWLTAPPPQAPPSWEASAASVRPLETVGGRQAVVINTLSNDPHFGARFNSTMDEAAALLAESNFSVTRINGSACTVDSMKTLGNAGAVMFLGHGLKIDYDRQGVDQGVWVQTGTRLFSWDGFVQMFSDDWRAGRVMPARTFWESVEAAVWGAEPMLGVTDRFFKHYYQDAGVRLNHALFFNCACESAKVPDLGNVLAASGVAAYLGWTEPQRIGPWTGVQLLRAMKAGWNLERALNSMSEEFKRDDDARLTYSPASGRTLQLQEAGTGFDPFRVTLSWDVDNDVDLHVFTANAHSYWSNKAIAAGSLDYDDVDGYGPEHFTASSRIPGTYYVAVNYYGDPRPGDSNYGYGRLTKAWVQVETPREVRNYGPRTLSSPNRNGGYPLRWNTSSWWRVCRIFVGTYGDVTLEPDNGDVLLGPGGVTTYSVQARHTAPRTLKPYELDGIGGDATSRRYLDVIQ